MNRTQKESKHFLEGQLEWIKEQDAILVEMDKKLHEMKRIAEYARDQELTSSEIEEVNQQFNELKQEVDSLEKQLHPVSH